MAEGGEPGIDYDQEAKGLSENDLTIMAKLLTKSGKFQVLSLGGAGAEQEDTPHKQQGAVSPELVRPKQPNYVPPVPAQGFMSLPQGMEHPHSSFPRYSSRLVSRCSLERSPLLRERWGTRSGTMKLNASSEIQFMHLLLFCRPSDDP